MPSRHAVPFQLRDLHTVVLRRRVGKLRALLVHQDARMRKVHMLDGKGTSQTFAITLFAPAAISPEWKQIHAQIRAGKFIGETFRAHGYEVRKNVVAVRVIELPEGLRQKFRTRGTHAKVRWSEFIARKNNGPPLVYAMVAEVYPPWFRRARIKDVDRRQINPPVLFLQKNGISLGELWERIGKNNRWKGREKERARALEAGQPVIRNLERVLNREIRRV